MTDEVDILTPENRLLSALLDMVIAHCERSANKLDSFIGWPANENAMRLLAERGLIEITSESEGRIEAKPLPQRARRRRVSKRRGKDGEPRRSGKDNARSYDHVGRRILTDGEAAPMRRGLFCDFPKGPSRINAKSPRFAVTRRDASRRFCQLTWRSEDPEMKNPPTRAGLSVVQMGCVSQTHST